MTDADSTDSPEVDSDKPVTSQEVPPGMLPLVEPVFGDGKSWKAFMITAFPFVVYLLGTSLGAHIEKLRKIEPAHTMRGVCRAMAKEFKGNIDASLTAEQSAEIQNRLELSKLLETLDDESSKGSELYQNIEEFRTAEISDLPPPQQAAIENLRKSVEHFFVLHDYEEEGEIDKIRDEHAQFLAEQGPGVDQSPLGKTWYPQLYSIACILALIVVIIALPGYFTQPFRISGLALGVGVLGIFVWLGLWWLDENVLGIGDYLAPNSRAAFNPWIELASPWSYAFVGIRLLGLCLVIPIAEEFFSRGFLMRYIEDIDWDQIPVGEATWKGWAGILVYGAMTHPGEIVAAIAWFALVTWLYLKTKNIWDCVVAHSVTNILLAVFVLWTGIWELW